MKIPKQIKISGHVIKVFKKRNLEMNGTPCLGLSYLAQNMIELASHIHGEKVPESKQAETFMHEIGHFINSIHSIGLNEKKNDEIALAFFQVIRDNRLNFLDME
jgi:hypothetical protein